MNKKDISKKGFLLTLGAFLILMVILSLAILIFHYTQRSEERVAETGISDRVSDLFISVQESIIEIFDIYSDLEVVIIKNADGTTDVSFTESLTDEKSNWGDKFNERVEALKEYIENKEPHIEIYQEELKLRDKVPLIILPYNIEYYRSWEGGQLKLGVTPPEGELQFNSYDVVVNTHDIGITKIEFTTSKPDSFNFRVTAKNNWGYEETVERTVDPKGPNNVHVDTDEGTIMVTFQKDFQGRYVLETWSPSKQIITITTTVDQLEETEEEVRVEFTKNLISVNFEELGTSKTSTVTLAA